MKDRKLTGSYYTPEFLSKFILSYVAPHFKDQEYLSVFEPSVGDGSFVKAFNETNFPSKIKQFSFTGIDKILPELRKAELKAKATKRSNTRYSFSRIDFLKYQKTSIARFSLITGNPPYIRKGLLKKNQISLCEEIHRSANLAPLTIKNIWPSFLVRCSQLLNDNGVLTLVLPAELLQVKFSAELRTFLTSNFQRTEIFTFDDLLFECKGQDTVLLIAYKQSRNPGQFFTHIENNEQLEKNEFKLVKNTTLTSSETKWSHHLLTSDELNFIHKLAKSLKSIDNFCESKPGIVTAANSFFIVDRKTEKKYGLTRYTRPIIQKGLFVNGSIVFDELDYSNLVASGKPSKILCIADKNADRLPESVMDYLAIGEDLDLQGRYKCLKRRNWFVVPNISTIPEGFFFKRSHYYPKLLKNKAEVLVTDSAYKIQMRKGHKINHLIYSFYNSLTLIFAELEGRYYGGGVLELTPTEFKKLPIPIVSIGARDFNIYTKAFENKTEIADILNLSDFSILNSVLKLNDEEINLIRGIREKLTSKRFREKK
jgi:adenine-specific DNA-methyltransferase